MTTKPSSPPTTFAKSNLTSPAVAPADPAKPIRLLRIQQVLELVGLKKATVYELQRTGQFPRSVKITSRAVGWVEEEVQQWLAERRNRRS
jgi:prophage regulatory protein